MKYCYRKTLFYSGIVITAFIIYGGLILLWSLLEPWQDVKWNNNALRANGVITDHEIRHFFTDGRQLYIGYIMTHFGKYWAQLRAITDITTTAEAQKILTEQFAINTTVSIYYYTSPSDSSIITEVHLGPRSNIGFIVWCMLSITLFIGIVTCVIIIIYHDHQKHYRASEHMRLYNEDEIKMSYYTPSYNL